LTNREIFDIKWSVVALPIHFIRNARCAYGAQKGECSVFTPEFFERMTRCRTFGDIVFVSTGVQNGTVDLFGGNILHAALPSVPRTGFGYVVLRGGFTEETADIFNLRRLKGVVQLSGLQKPSGELYRHTRFTHSLDARAIALLMALSNDLEPSLTRTFELAGIIHDVLTSHMAIGLKEAIRFSVKKRNLRVSCRERHGSVSVIAIASMNDCSLMPCREAIRSRHRSLTLQIDYRISQTMWRLFWDRTVSLSRFTGKDAPRSRNLPRVGRICSAYGARCV
jgi:hypothetical protein